MFGTLPPLHVFSIDSMSCTNLPKDRSTILIIRIHAVWDVEQLRMLTNVIYKCTFIKWLRQVDCHNAIYANGNRFSQCKQAPNEQMWRKSLGIPYCDVTVPKIALLVSQAVWKQFCNVLRRLVARVACCFLCERREKRPHFQLASFEGLPKYVTSSTTG